MGQLTAMQLLPRWIFRGKNLRVYESGGRSRRHGSKHWVSRRHFTAGAWLLCDTNIPQLVSLHNPLLFLLDKTRHPRRPRPSGRRRPRRSWRSGTCTRVSKWRRTRPTTGEGLTDAPREATGAFVTTSSGCEGYFELGLCQNKLAFLKDELCVCF